MKKPIVIAGNGPSLAQIDYSRLPEDFDVFRCNQFYFEDKYFLGKKIKGVFFNPEMIARQYFTCHHLKKNKEYEIEDIYCSRCDDGDFFINGNRLESIFPTVKNTYDYLKKLPRFDELYKFYYLYFYIWPTAGIKMLYTAIAQGYKEIYLTGIDFYRGGGIDYAFKIKTNSNLCQAIPAFINSDFKDRVHTESLDMEFIQLALEMQDVKVYAISPNSALSGILPLAPIQNCNYFELKNKPEGYICDLMIPPNEKKISRFKQRLKDYDVDGKNFYVKALMDLKCILLALFSFIKKPF